MLTILTHLTAYYLKRCCSLIICTDSDRILGSTFLYQVLSCHIQSASFGSIDVKYISVGMRFKLAPSEYYLCKYYRPQSPATATLSLSFYFMLISDIDRLSVCRGIVHTSSPYHTIPNSISHPQKYWRASRPAIINGTILLPYLNEGKW